MFSSTPRRRASGPRRGLKWSSILADTQVGTGFGRGGNVEDLLGLGEDKWWERLLDRWKHLPDRLRTSIERGLIGALVVGVFLLLNLLMGMPLG
jgi:hypothetical protein